MSSRCEYCGRLTELGTFGLTCPRCAEPEDNVPALKQRLETLERALESIRDCNYTITLPDRMDAVRDIARKALE